MVVNSDSDSPSYREGRTMLTPRTLTPLSTPPNGSSSPTGSTPVSTPRGLAGIITVLSSINTEVTVEWVMNFAHSLESEMYREEPIVLTCDMREAVSDVIKHLPDFRIWIPHAVAWDLAFCRLPVDVLFHVAICTLRIVASLGDTNCVEHARNGVFLTFSKLIAHKYPHYKAANIRPPAFFKRPKKLQLEDFEWSLGFSVNRIRQIRYYFVNFSRAIGHKWTLRDTESVLKSFVWTTLLLQSPIPKLAAVIVIDYLGFGTMSAEASLLRLLTKIALLDFLELQRLLRMSMKNSDYFYISATQESSSQSQE